MADPYVGLLVIGDPHLEGRQPGFRKDDYPNVILEKLAWCLEYAAANRLLPAILGDLFDKPRDNPNWMLVRLIELLSGEVIGLYGNHDCADPELKDHDSLSLLVRSGRLRLVCEAEPWRGTIGGRAVVIGGSSYRQPIPKHFSTSVEAGSATPLVIWLTHHDILIPGYDEGRIKPFEIVGVELLINGHIHRRLEEVRAGRTRWLTPGNISRRSRSDASRDHVPAALRIDISPEDYQLSYVEIPHRPFGEVFHALVLDAPAAAGASAFVAGLAELQARRTASGAGLMEFLEQNVIQFSPSVAAEIMHLAMEVTNDGVSPVS
jgi:DNA repair exonuclease SbcCD nuclease subunit